MSFKGILFFVALLFGLWEIPPAWGFFKQDGRLRPGEGSSRDESNRHYFTDLPVITQEGKELRFYSDILKDRVVLINFFYVNCPTSPPDMTKLSEVQKKLGEELGKKVRILSLSVNPEKDSPEAVRTFAEPYNPEKGRLFLTGKKEHLEVINRKLGNYHPNPEYHLQLFLLGNLKTGHWMKLNRLAPVVSIVQGLLTLSLE